MKVEWIVRVTHKRTVRDITGLTSKRKAYQRALTERGMNTGPITRHGHVYAVYSGGD